MNILGISAFYHDSAACLVQDGKIVNAAQEERFTREKHDSSFPANAIRFCLSDARLTAADLDCIAFYDKPFVKFERILETYLAFAPRGIRSFMKAIPLWIKQKLWIKELIADKLAFEGPIIFPEHHESHAASAFFPSPFQEAAFVTIDGVGEWATTSFGVGKDNAIRILGELHFPHSLGLLYSAFTYHTGFRVNSGEYKVMGLAPYGEPKYKDLILNELMELKEDGSFRLNMDYFDYCAGLTMTNERFDRLFGKGPRKPESPLTQEDMDMARSVQDVTEEVMLRLCRHAHAITGQKRLCLAGGVALNCVGNGRILREGPFEKLWIQPAAGDAGGALGAALFAWHQYFGRKRQADDMHDAQSASYLGPAFDDARIGRYLQKHRIPHVELDGQSVPKRVADLIADQKVIGFFNGRMEFGPRALGARSIIGDARSAEMQETMNLKIKFRESFRPFAPSVLAERASEYFGLDAESPYMLLVAPVQERVRRRLDGEEQQLTGLAKLRAVRSGIPAVTHVDYSARVQTVTSASNPLYYQTIAAFADKCGCPVIVNTSFNVRGEPIVCTPADAYRCFMKTHMDYLVMGRFLLDKKEQGPVAQDSSWRDGFDAEWDAQPEADIAADRKEMRKFGLVMTVFFALLGGIILWRGGAFYWLCFAISASFLSVGLAAPAVLKPVCKGWMKFAAVMGWFMSRVILVILFYLVLTPTALLLRLFGKDVLGIGVERAPCESYWVAKKVDDSQPRDYKRQF